MSKVRVRIRFSKTGDLRWISHRDLARVWERLLRRAGLQLAFSEGFHPKPKISFPSALALGIVALDEIVEMDLVGPVDMAGIETRIAAELPAGMQLLSIEQMLPGVPKAVVISMTYEIALPVETAALARDRAAELLAAGKLVTVRDGKTIEVAFSDERLNITCEESLLRFTLPANSHGSLRPIELLEALGIAHVLADGIVLTRTHVTLGSASQTIAVDAASVASASLINQDNSNI